MALDARIVKEGALRRLNTSSAATLWPMSKWQKYHAVLDDRNNVAFYSSSEGKLRGQLVLTDATAVNLSDKRPHSFRVKTAYADMDLQAMSDADRDEWIAALLGAVARVGEEARQKDKAEKWKAMRRKAQQAKAEQAAAAQPKPTGRGTHVFTVNAPNHKTETFEVDARYEFKRHIGQGAYGVVVAARDATAGTDVAIKKIKNVFDHHVDGKRVLREVKIMRFLGGHPNLSHILDLMRPPPPSEEEQGEGDPPDDFNDLYIVMPLMDTDLHRVIHSNQKLSDQHVQFLLFQLLSAVHFMESASIVHRDLKPSNILVNAACELKICDFGLARALDDSGIDDFATTYVVTRWYRAPELLLSCRDYTPAIDMWSVGCILAELFIRRALFPGDDYYAQIGLILDVLGTPQNDDFAFVKEDSAIKFLKDMTYKPKRAWRDIADLRDASDVCLDLLDKLLAFSPDRRISAKDALAHPYLQVYWGQPLRESPGTFGNEDRELRKFLESADAKPEPGAAGGKPLSIPEQKKRKEQRQKALLREAMMSEIARYGRDYRRGSAPAAIDGGGDDDADADEEPRVAAVGGKQAAARGAAVEEKREHP